MVEELTHPPQILDCDPVLWFGEKGKIKPTVQKHSLLPLVLSAAVAAVGF